MTMKSAERKVFEDNTKRIAEDILYAMDGEDLVTVLAALDLARFRAIVAIAETAQDARALAERFLSPDHVAELWMEHQDHLATCQNCLTRKTALN